LPQALIGTQEVARSFKTFGDPCIMLLPKQKAPRWASNRKTIHTADIDAFATFPHDSSAVKVTKSAFYSNQITLPVPIQ